MKIFHLNSKILYSNKILIISLSYILFFYGIGNCKATAPVNLNLNYSKNLILNTPWKISFSITPLVETIESNARIIIPDGIELISGDTQRNNNIAKNDTLTLEADLLFPKIGEYKIIGDFRFKDQFGNQFGKSKAVYIIITDKSIEVSEMHFSNIKRMRIKKKLEQQKVKNMEMLSKEDPLFKEMMEANRVEAEESNE